MKEPYRKGVAIHPDPESCAGDGNIAGEALTGAHTGQPLSSEISLSACRPRTCEGKATLAVTLLREPLPGAAESKTLSMCGNSLRENREILLDSVRNGGDVTSVRNGQKTFPTVQLI